MNTESTPHPKAHFHRSQGNAILKLQVMRWDGTKSPACLPWLVVSLSAGDLSELVFLHQGFDVPCEHQILMPPFL